MSDADKYVIPSRLDDPERWLFWTLDEAAALLGPAVLGLAYSEAEYQGFVDRGHIGTEYDADIP